MQTDWASCEKYPPPLPSCQKIRRVDRPVAGAHQQIVAVLFFRHSRHVLHREHTQALKVSGVTNTLICSYSYKSVYW